MLTLWLQVMILATTLTWEQEQLQTHLRRLATLDVIFELAGKKNETALAERAEGLRRKEVAHFFVVMKKRAYARTQKLLQQTP